MRKALFCSALLAILLSPVMAAAQLRTIPQDRAGARGAANLCDNGTAWTPCSAANPLPVTAGPPTGGLSTNPSQHVGSTANSQTTGAANTAVVITSGATASQATRVYSIMAYCSAGTSTITITDGGTTIWGLPAGSITTTAATVAWPVPLTGAVNSAVVVTLATCGVGNTGTLAVQLDKY